LSPEVADYFGENKTEDVSKKEEVTPDDKGKEVVEDKTKENDSKENEDKKPESEKDKKEEAEEEKKEGDLPDEYEVAGKKYSSLEEAIKAVNSISGANSQLAGELKSKSRQLNEANEKVVEITKLLEDYKIANEAWAKYYEGEGAKPDSTKENIEAEIMRVVENLDKKKSEKAQKEQYQTELDEIFSSEDIQDVLPVFKELVDEYGDSPKVSPKKLYERARTLVKGSKTDLSKEVEERVRKELAKKEAVKGSGTSGGSTKNEDPLEELSPEIADYIKSNT
jgi:hypothetical protein